MVVEFLSHIMFQWMEERYAPSRTEARNQILLPNCILQSLSFSVRDLWLPRQRSTIEVVDHGKCSVQEVA